MEKELQLTEALELLKQYPGRYFLDAEQEQLNAILAVIHGFYLVQLGAVDSYNLQVASTIIHRLYVGCNLNHGAHLARIESNFSQLPFQFESIDTFILPHTLEFVAQPRKLLHEIYNCLIPGGKVVILGFNPFSVLGLNRFLTSAKRKPWCGKLYSSRYLKSLLRAMGFSLEHEKSFCFVPPCKNVKTIKKLSFLESLRYIFPFLGSDYVLLAEKKVLPLSSTKFKVSPKIPVTSGFPEPSANKGL
jgi:SAM-dependent methyltransferase